MQSLVNGMNRERVLSVTAFSTAFAEHAARPRAIICMLAAMLAASCIADARAELAIVDLGRFPGAPTDALRWQMGVSADGRIVVGSIDNRAFFWDGTLHELQGGKVATATSADGSVVVGTLSSRRHAFRWTAASGLQDLGTLPGSTGSDALGVSGDGSVVVGTAETPQGPLAWIWDATAGMRNLGTLGADMPIAAANAISHDGRIVVGYSGNESGLHAFRWTAETGMVDITPQLPGPGVAGAYAISADNATIVGSYNPNPSGVRQPALQFRWTASDGFKDLASPDTGAVSPGQALATDRTGSHIFGYVLNYFPYASVWSHPTGVVHLDDYLQSQGLDLAGWTLQQVQAVSDDGDVVVGTGLRMEGENAATVSWRISGLSTVGPVFADGFDIGG